MIFDVAESSCGLRCGPCAGLGGGSAGAGPKSARPGEMKRRALLETYHVASTAARIIAHALVTQLAYFVCSWPWLQNRSYTENHHRYRLRKTSI
jgi:hypothetical protein